MITRAPHRSLNGFNSGAPGAAAYLPAGVGAGGAGALPDVGAVGAAGAHQGAVGTGAGAGAGGVGAGGVVAGGAGVRGVGLEPTGGSKMPRWSQNTLYEPDNTANRGVETPVDPVLTDDVVF